MESHGTTSESASERLNLHRDAWRLYVGAQLCGVVGLIAAIALGLMYNDSFKHFFFAYLVAYFFFLTIALGGLFVTILQHLTKAGWSVNIRRIAEWLASTMPLMTALAAPIVVTMLLGNGQVYPWAAAHADHDPERWWFKSVYLDLRFVLVRMVFYYLVWSFLGVWYWKQSTQQDATGDIRLTSKMQRFAPVAMILFGLTLTFGSFDMLMSLDPEWSSTIFGVYVFSGSAVSAFASIILIVRSLQSRGYLRESVTIEHFHDLGKFLFGFTIFWAYIAFSQYMLLWYGNIPDEVAWYNLRGATTAAGKANEWSIVTLLLLFCHFIIPFAVLLSRHVKRNPRALGFMAVWMLVFHWFDILWIIKPQESSSVLKCIGPIDLAVFLGIGGLFLTMVIRKAGHDALRPLHDPRLPDSLAFENI